MPSSNDKKLKHPNRNYRKEYDAFYGAPGKPHEWTALQKEHRKDKSGRSRARKAMTRRYGSAALKKLDVDHKNCNPQDNRLSNLILRPVRANRNGSVCKAVRRFKNKKLK